MRSGSTGQLSLTQRHYNQLMSYASALGRLYALGGELATPAGSKARRKFDLNHMRVLAAALGNPQTTFPSVLIAGTNGKGSTAAALASILNVAGYRTGLYTSPHLIRVNERVQLATGLPGANTLAEIDDDSFARLYFKVDDVATRLVADGKLSQHPSFFEVMTALAFLAFAEANVEIAVLEVGLGGRLDATNIVEPVLSVITDIALDHMEWLGNTITEIAREKAGILRTSGVLVTLPQHGEANAAIGEVAISLGVTGINAAAFLPDRSVISGPYAIQIGRETLVVDSPLPGEHQHRNLALAIAASTYLQQDTRFRRITPSAIASGIRQTRWPGRLQRITRPDGGIVLLDVAHNPAGVWTLRSYLSRAMDNGSLPFPYTLIFSALRDKAVLEMAQILFPLFEETNGRILLAPIASPRAASTDQLATTASELGTPVTLCGSVQHAMDLASERPGSVVVSGSVYLVGEATAWLQQRGWA